MPSFTTTPADSGFIPRKEFIREQRTTTNTFCLLTLSGSNAVRLYSFPPPVIATLRRLFDQNGLTTAFRQDVNLNLCEFSLDGRPWANPKTVSSEKLLIDILAIVFQHGYLYLSTIDYGRERDDRLAIAFSKPSFLSDSSIRSGSPAPTSPDPCRSGSTTSHLPTAQRVAFALSFTSATRLRVISPPLHSTPAILQAVRGSWPRGVVSEKKVAEATFEFKLKGYKWFHEDTFATDSLRHILSILSSLDTHSFSLLTSLSLSNRSRVKDLWIFTGSAPPSDQETTTLDSPTPSIFNSPNGEPRMAQGSSPEQPFNSQPLAQHRRYASAPTSQRRPYSPPSNLQHGRSATEHVVSHGISSSNIHGYDNPPDQGNPTAGSGLRKAAPRAQIPISVMHDIDDHGIRATLPSTVSSDVENMTGIGAATSAAGWRSHEPLHPRDIIYEKSPATEDNSEIPLSQITPAQVDVTDRPRSRSPPGRYRPLRPVSTRSKTPPLLKSNPPSSTPPGHLPTSAPAQVQAFPTTVQPLPHNGRSSSVGTIPLLGPGVFRDSAFSSTSNASVEIPIKWTGGGVGEDGQDRRKRKSKSSPTVPGGWTPTPIKGLPEEGQGVSNADSNDDDNGERAVQEVISRVALPEVTHHAERLIKSEVGSVGVIVQPSPPPPPPPTPPAAHSKGKGKEVHSDGSMHGWVLVNVEGRKSPAENRSSPESVVQSGRSSSPSSPRSPNGTASSPSKVQKKPTAEYSSSMSAPAKAIAIVDAVDAHSKSSKSKTKPSPLKRLFGLRKNSKEKEKSQLRPQAGSQEQMNTPGRKRLTID